MKYKKILVGVSILMISSLLIGACSSATETPAAPTIDPNTIYTQAAQTVQASIAKTDEAQPTPTQEPTETPAPTNTVDPTAEAILTSTAESVLPPAGNEGQVSADSTQTPEGVVGGADATPTTYVLPTATSAAALPPAASTGEKCEWVANSPQDGTKIQKNNGFDATIVVKNSGTTTWDNRYALRYFAGERMGAPTDYFVQSEVKPGEMYKFIFPMTAPSSTGNKEVLFVVQSPEGVNMCWINIPLEITD